jgi:hypothetical protein
LEIFAHDCLLKPTGRLERLTWQNQQEKEKLLRKIIQSEDRYREETGLIIKNPLN